MEIIIFRKNEIDYTLFTNQRLLVYDVIVKNQEYGNYIFRQHCFIRCI